VEMQVDLTTVLSVLSTIASLGFAAWLTTARYAWSNREKDIDRRIEDVRSLAAAVDTRLHTEEKATIRQDGEISLVKQTHGNIDDDVQEIKRTMVTKVELQHLIRTTDQILQKIEGRRYTPPAIGRVDPSELPPKR